jgi:hypothetical protein
VNYPQDRAAGTPEYQPFEKAQAVLPEHLKSEDERRQLAQRIQEWCQASDLQLADMGPTWKQVDDAQKNDSKPSINPPWPGAPTFKYPVVEPNLDKSRAFVAQPLCKADPFILIRAGGPTGQRSGPIEQALHLLKARAQYPRYVRQALDITFRRGKACPRVLFEPAKELPNGRRLLPKLRYDVFTPENVVRYPNWAVRMEDAICVGTRYEMSLGEIQSLQKSGFFLSDPVREGKEPDALQENFKQSREDNAVEAEHGAVTMRDLWIRGWTLGEHPECWFRVWFWNQGPRILRIEKWMQRRPPLFDFFLHEEYNRWINERCRGRSLMGPERFNQGMRDLYVWSVMYQIAPPAFLVGFGLDKTAQRPAPGSFIPLQQGGQVLSTGGRMDMSAFPHMIQLAKEDAELAGHLALQAHGINRPGITATAVRSAGLGQDVGVDEDAAYANIGLTEMADYELGDLMYDHFLEWYPYYRDAVPTGIRQTDFDGAYWLEHNGQTILNTPESMMMQVTQLTQSIANMIQMAPWLAQQYPDMFAGILRAAVEATNLENKDSLLPTPEEEESARAAQEQAYASNLEGTLGGALQLQGLGISPELLGP